MADNTRLHGLALSAGVMAELKCENAIIAFDAWLIENGYDGLHCPMECACKVGDINPCGELSSDCEPGYSHPGDNEYDFYIQGKKDATP